MSNTVNFDSVLDAHNLGTTSKEKKNTDEKTQKTSKQDKKREMKQACYDVLDDTYHILRSDIAKYRQFLDFQSYFESYSTNNNVLIFAQRPGATKVKDFDGWSSEDLTVRKGVKGIMILMPRPYEKDGQQRTAYEVKKVFDISDLKEPPAAESVSFDDSLLVRALVNKSPVPIKTVENYPSKNSEGAYYDVKDKCIYARQGMEFEELFTAIAQSLAHAEMARSADTYRVSDHAFQARSAAYVIAKKHGVPTARLQISGLPPRYESMELKEIKEEFGDIHRCVKNISVRMNEILFKPREQERKNEDKGER